MFQVKYDGQLRTEQDVHSLACDVHCLRVQKSNSGANEFMKWTDGGYHGSRYFINQKKSQLNIPPGRWQVAEWVVRDAAFGQGEVGSDLIFVIFSPQMYFWRSIFLHMKVRKLWQNKFCNKTA